MTSEVSGPGGKRRWREKGGATAGWLRCGVAAPGRSFMWSEKIGEEIRTGWGVFSAGFELTGGCDLECSPLTVTGGHEISSEFFIISF